ncbi:tyrosine-type recombinase/integrase [bacterium]|nr:tyrosine-type recombinase/integrase [bacterium]
MAKKNKKDHHLKKRRDVWYFEAMVRGKRIKKALSGSITDARILRDKYLKEISLLGDIQRNEPVKESKLFGEVAQQWAKIMSQKVKSSTMKDYRGAMNYYILPKFGNVPINDIDFRGVEEFRSTMKCSNKRKNNVLVPMRSLMKFAFRAGLIDKNPMDLVENLTVSKPDIYPMSIEEVHRFLDIVNPQYKNFFIVAFYSGMRFGEMAALKWKNIDFKLGVIKVRETRVRKEEGRPKTAGSIRDIKMLPPTVEAFRDQRKATMGKSDYVFLNFYGRPLLPNSVSFHIWKPGLKKAGLKPRSLYQTRHTFATLMLDAGELPGWVQKMMGHESLKMILERYYSYIKNYQRDDGSAFMDNVYNPSLKETDKTSDEDEKSENFTPNLHQDEKRKLA